MTGAALAQVSRGDLKQLRETVRRTPTDAGAWFALGVSALEAGEVGEARFAFTQSVYLAPQDVPQAVQAADMLAGAGCAPEAEHLLRRVLERSSDAREAHVRLADLLIETGRAAQAVNELTVALQSNPGDVDLHLLAATAYQRLGQRPEAADHLGEALALEPNHIEAGRRRGAALSELGDTAGAVRCWRRLVMITAGQDLPALTGLGISLSSDGKHVEALQILREVVRRQENAATLADLGMALTAADDIDAATRAFKRALEIEPRSAQAYCGLGLAYQRQERWHEAAQAFRATEQLSPDSAVGALNLGLALVELGDREGARRALARAAALEPHDPEIRDALDDVTADVTAVDHAPEAAPISLAFGTTPTPVVGEGRGFEASITGDLKSFQLFDVLEFLRLQRKTGSLVVSSRQGAGVIRLTEGALTSASAPRVKRLGDALVDSRLITRAQLELALAHQREEPQENIESLGSVLLRERLIDRDKLTTAIRKQVMAALQDMVTWQEGGFSFHPSAEGESAPPVTLDLREVTLKLMRLADETNSGRPRRPD
jgi:Flp pilus assembly protein TadD